MDAFFKEPRNPLTGQYWAPIDSIAPVRLEDLSNPEEPESTPRRRVRGLDLLIGTAGVAALVVLAVFVVKEMTGSSAARAAPPAATATPRPAKALVHPPPEPRAPEPVKVAEAPKPVEAPRPVEAPSAAPAVAPSAAAAAESPAAASSQPTTALASTAPPSPSASVAPASPEASAASPPKPRRKKVPKDHTPPTASFPD